MTLRERLVTHLSLPEYLHFTPKIDIKKKIKDSTFPEPTYVSAYPRVDEVKFFTNRIQLINTEGIIDLENHHFSISGKQWI